MTSRTSDARKGTTGLDDFARTAIDQTGTFVFVSGESFDATIVAVRRDTVYIHREFEFAAVPLNTIQSFTIQHHFPIALVSIPGCTLAGGLIGGMVGEAVSKSQGDSWAAFSGLVYGASLGAVCGVAIAIFSTNSSVYYFPASAAAHAP